LRTGLPVAVAHLAQDAQNGMFGGVAQRPDQVGEQPGARKDRGAQVVGNLAAHGQHDVRILAQFMRQLHQNLGTGRRYLVAFKPRQVGGCHAAAGGDLTQRKSAVLGRACLSQGADMGAERRGG